MTAPTSPARAAMTQPELGPLPYDLPPRRFAGWSVTATLPAEDCPSPADLAWPACLSLPPEPQLTVVCNRSAGVGHGRSQPQDPEDVASELMVGVTVLVDGTPGSLLLGGWIDNPASLLFGRELFGFPKRFARIVTSAMTPLRGPVPDEGVWMSVSERGHAVGAMRCSVLDADDRDEPRGVGGRFYSWRRIPAADGTGVALSELLEARSRVLSVGGSWEATADIDITWWPDDRWAPALTGDHRGLRARVTLAERELDWPHRIWSDPNQGS